jgi:hypothetical protein
MQSPNKRITTALAIAAGALPGAAPAAANNRTALEKTAIETKLAENPNYARTFYNEAEGRSLDAKIPKTLSPSKVQLSMIKLVKGAKVTVEKAPPRDEHGVKRHDVVKGPPTSPWPAGDIGESGGVPDPDSIVLTMPFSGPLDLRQSAFNRDEVGSKVVADVGPAGQQANANGFLPIESGIDLGLGQPAALSTEAGKTISGDPGMPGIGGPSTEAGVGPAGQTPDADGFLPSEEPKFPFSGPLDLKKSPFTTPPAPST